MNDHEPESRLCNDSKKMGYVRLPKYDFKAIVVDLYDHGESGLPLAL
jgi:hypothetical protein